MRHRILFYSSLATTWTVKTALSSGRGDAGMCVTGGKLIHRSAARALPTGQKEIRKKMNKTTRFNSVHVAKTSPQTLIRSWRSALGHSAL